MTPKRQLTLTCNLKLIRVYLYHNTLHFWMLYHLEHVLSNSLVFFQIISSGSTDLYKRKLDVLKYNNACLLIYYFMFAFGIQCGIWILPIFCSSRDTALILAVPDAISVVIPTAGISWWWCFRWIHCCIQIVFCCCCLSSIFSHPYCRNTHRCVYICDACVSHCCVSKCDARVSHCCVSKCDARVSHCCVSICDARVSHCCVSIGDARVSHCCVSICDTRVSHCCVSICDARVSHRCVSICVS